LVAVLVAIACGSSSGAPSGSDGGGAGEATSSTGGASGEAGASLGGETSGGASSGGGETSAGASSGGETDGGTGAGGEPSGGASAGSQTSGGVDSSGGSKQAGPCEAGTSYPEPALDGSPTRVYSATGNGLFEGVLWLGRGVLFFSDIGFNADPNPSTLRELTPPDTVQAFLPDSGTNGLALDPNGEVLACAHDVQGIVRIDPVTADKTVWVDQYQGNSFNSPNDLTVRSDGTVYFSDPDYQLGSRQSETGITGLYRVTPAGEVSVIDDTLPNPNGVALSPDQTVLYVGDEDGNVWRYSVAADGTVSNRQSFATIDFPDGVGVDCAGNLYVADHQQGAVRVFAPDGSALGSINVAPSVTNIAFGGSDHQTLYISAGMAIYTFNMNLPGYPY